MAFVFPYVFVIVGMFALIIVVIVFAHTMECVVFATLSILILAVGVFLSLGLAMLAGDIFRLRLYLGMELEDKEVD